MMAIEPAENTQNNLAKKTAAKRRKGNQPPVNANKNVSENYNSYSIIPTNQMGYISGYNNNCGANTLLSYFFDKLLEDNSPLTNEILNQDEFTTLLNLIKNRVDELIDVGNVGAELGDIANSWDNFKGFLKNLPNTDERERYFGDCFRRFIAKLLENSNEYKTRKINDGLILPTNTILQKVLYNQELEEFIIKDNLEEEDKNRLTGLFVDILSKNLETKLNREMIVKDNLEFFIEQCKELIKNRPNCKVPEETEEYFIKFCDDETIKNHFVELSKKEKEKAALLKAKNQSEHLSNTIINNENTNIELVTTLLNAKNIADNAMVPINKELLQIKKSILTRLKTLTRNNKNLKKLIKNHPKVFLDNLKAKIIEGINTSDYKSSVLFHEITRDFIEDYALGLTDPKSTDPKLKTNTKESKYLFNLGKNQFKIYQKYWNEKGYKLYLNQLADPKNAVMIDVQELFWGSRHLNIQAFYYSGTPLKIYSYAGVKNLPNDQRLGNIHFTNQSGNHWQLIYSNSEKAQTHNSSRNNNYSNPFKLKQAIEPSNSDTSEQANDTNEQNNNAFGNNGDILNISPFEEINSYYLDEIKKSLENNPETKTILVPKYIDQDYRDKLKSILQDNTSITNITCDLDEEKPTIKDKALLRLIAFNKRIKKIMQDGDKFSIKKMFSFSFLVGLTIVLLPPLNISVSFVSLCGGFLLEVARWQKNIFYKNQINNKKNAANWSDQDKIDAKQGYLDKAQGETFWGPDPFLYKPCAYITYYGLSGIDANGKHMFSENPVVPPEIKDEIKPSGW